MQRFAIKTTTTKKTTDLLSDKTRFSLGATVSVQAKWSDCIFQDRNQQTISTFSERDTNNQRLPFSAFEAASKIRCILRAIRLLRLLRASLCGFLYTWFLRCVGRPFFILLHVSVCQMLCVAFFKISSRDKDGQGKPSSSSFSDYLTLLRSGGGERFPIIPFIYTYIYTHTSFHIVLKSVTSPLNIRYNLVSPTCPL